MALPHPRSAHCSGHPLSLWAEAAQVAAGTALGLHWDSSRRSSVRLAHDLGGWLGTEPRLIWAQIIPVLSSPGSQCWVHLGVATAELGHLEHKHRPQRGRGGAVGVCSQTQQFCPLKNGPECL